MTQYVDGIAEIPQSRCIVSDDYRTITIPAKERTLGCVGDDETRRVWWDVPLSNDGISLRGFELSIHYVNAAGHSNRYDVAEAHVVDDRILFSWLVQRGAYEAAGLVNVSIKMRTLDGADVVDEFNSAIAPFSVKNAQSYDEQPQPEQEDYIGAFIAQQSARVDAAIARVDIAIEDAEDATQAANTAATSATTAAQLASQAATAANSAATDASAAATDATDAAERAEQAAEGVESAIDAATSAAASANGAAATATAAASNADSKATLATQAASTANQAAQAAESATTAATTATQAANTAAGQATTAAGNADAKAQLADTAATNADTATAAANTATTNATNAVQAANNAADVAIEAAEDMPRLIGTVNTVQAVVDAWPTTMEGATLYGKCVQDGTPTPENPVPVQVVEGRNLLAHAESATVNGVTWAENSDGSFTVNGTATAISTRDFGRGTTVLQPGTYTVNMTEGAINVDVWDRTTLSIIKQGGGTFTISELTDIFVRFYIVSGATVDTTIYPQLEVGAQATPYLPYGCIGLKIGEDITPIDLQGYTLAGGDVLKVDSAGRVWIDKGAGVKVIDGSSPIWVSSTSGAYTRFGLSNQGNAKGNLLSPTAQFEDYLPNLDAMPNGIGTGNADNRIYFTLTANETTVAQATAYLTAHPITVYYHTLTRSTIELGTIDLPELTQPCELAIYASLDPEWEITYTQDPNVVISTLTGSIAPIEGATASTNYAVGAYLIHANQLYRVTSAIATGEAITPGSNCVACTVMGELVRLTA